MRLFISIPVAPLIASRLSEFFHQDIPGLKWTKISNLHVTVFFIGETQQQNIPKIKKQLNQLLSSIQPFSLSFNQLTFGPHRKASSMIWAQLHHTEQWSHLVTTVMAAVKKAVPSVKTYSPKSQTPHITLARFSFKDQSIPSNLNLNQANLTGLKLAVTEIRLMQSELTPEGSIYTPLETFPLG
jgi:RNA 2',3'-cyclic 3'-phosphodiesterase